MSYADDLTSVASNSTELNETTERMVEAVAHRMGFQLHQKTCKNDENIWKNKRRMRRDW